MDTGSLILVVGVLLVGPFAAAGSVAALLAPRVVVDGPGHFTD